MPRNFAPALIAGVVSAILYLVVFAFGLGFLFLFLPTLPVLWLGLKKQSLMSLYACLTGLILLCVFSNPVNALLLYFACLTLPSWYIAHESLKSGQHGTSTIWFPLTTIFARLMTAAVFMLLIITLAYSNHEGGLPGMIAPHISDAFHMLSPEMDTQTSTIIKTMAPNLAFLVFCVSAWMWAACIYLHAWIVNRELIRQKLNIRPDMAIDASPPPNWMISLLIITAVASLLGSASLAFWGKASLVILLFPYFLLGLSLLHRNVRTLQYRFFLLFSIYFLLASLLWPALIIAGYGFIYHVRLLNKYLSAGGTSFRS